MRNPNPWVAAGLFLTEEWVDGLKRKSGQTRLYCIRMGIDGPVKIGIARNPIQRLLTLQVGCPQALHLVAVVPAPRCVERVLHTALAVSRIHGEWFEPSPEVERLVSELRNLELVLEDYARELGEVDAEDAAQIMLACQ